MHLKKPTARPSRGVHGGYERPAIGLAGRFDSQRYARDIPPDHPIGKPIPSD
jgi:hypothetical protein